MLILASVVVVMQLVLDPAMLTPDLSLPIITKEVRTIWAPYMEVVLTTGDQSCVRCDGRLEVQFTDAPSVSGPETDAALGWIRFVNGQPEPIVSVSIDRARRALADAVWMGRQLHTLPPAVTRRFLSQAVARTIAHEMGHFVLRSALHQSAGLMKARFSIRDLMAGDPGRLKLSPFEEARLEGSPSSYPATVTTASPGVTGERW